MKPITKVLMGLGIATAISLGQTDPGPRKGTALSGQPLPGLNSAELALFEKGKDAFSEVDGVPEGLGPRFNSDSCVSCHSHPAVGGTAPAINPQVAVASKAGARNTLPWFITQNGPVREVRTRSEGGVRPLFVTTGRNDAPQGCRIQQPDFTNPFDLVFRIPTPAFGLGLVESITDSALKANLAANSTRKRQLGIQGRFNTNGNDGTITRFGWKAQNKSLAIFSGEAYNVEVGVTNEMFPQEREEDPACATTGSIESSPDIEHAGLGDVGLFAMFMRFLAAPVPAATNATIDRGRQVFDTAGCTMCHTPSLTTGKSYTAALDRKIVPLYSDLAIHNMGILLMDNVSQGVARGDEFRTAPLWGLGERLFFLHDGRTKDLMEAIRQHDSIGSEASQTVRNFQSMSQQDKQAVLNFLRSL